MKVAVIGAGLSGLATTLRLQQAGVEVSLYEARPVAGGRIQPAIGVNQAGTHRATTHQDRGPSWVWPYAQPSVVSWFNELGLETFNQFDEGDSLIDSKPDQLPTRQFLPSQHGMVRVVGGTHAIISALLSRLTAPISYKSAVTGIGFDRTDDRIELKVDGASSGVTADRLIITLPPRLAASLVKSHASLKAVRAILEQTPTWMAQHAKVIMHYERAFWRDRGLCGRVVSHVGPLAEIHDHSGPAGEPAALFGFCGVPAAHRKQSGSAALADMVNQQLQRCFGEDAPMPIEIEIKDWALEEFTSADADLTGPAAHPGVANQMLRQAWADNRLWFAASETSSESPGLIDGALARADRVAVKVIESL